MILDKLSRMIPTHLRACARGDQEGVKARRNDEFVRALLAQSPPQQQCDENIERVYSVIDAILNNRLEPEKNSKHSKKQRQEPSFRLKHRERGDAAAVEHPDAAR